MQCVTALLSILAFTCSAGLVVTQGAFGADKRSNETERFAFFVDGNINTAAGVTVEIGMGMDPEIYKWIRAALDGTHITKNIEIHALDFEGISQSMREFTEALITEVTIPTLDASSTDPASMTVVFQAETVRYQKSDGSRIEGTETSASKTWISSNFRFTLGDLPVQDVQRIESFTVIMDEEGVILPTITVELSTQDIEPWLEWEEGAKEVSGQITFLSPDSTEELASIELQGVNIASPEIEKSDANSEEIAQVKVTLYVEQMDFTYAEAESDPMWTLCTFHEECDAADFCNAEGRCEPSGFCASIWDCLDHFVCDSRATCVPK